MDLTFSELDEYNFDDSEFKININIENNDVKNEIIQVNPNVTYTNYWHQNSPQQQQNSQQNNKNNKFKVLTYDDILNSLNLKVQNGNLELIQKQPPINTQKPQINIQKQPQNNTPINIQKQPPINTQSQPINTQDKSSYIYNKYFKDYKDSSVEEEPKKPMTREEYIQEHNRRVYERIRIEQIKSKKLMFSRENYVNISVSNPNHNLNRLFRM